MDKAIEIQQNLYENLGNREYDCFKTSEEKYLKLKIAYTLFGPPTHDETFNNLNTDYTAEQCYNKDQNKLINDFLKVIQSCSNYNSDPNEIIISFMFNCLINVKKDQELDYYPIFRVKKCAGSPTGNDCCQFIDEHLRIYNDWNDYLCNNKLPAGMMIIPKDGKYKGDSSNEVLLHMKCSPKMSIKEGLKKVGDTTSTTVSIVSGGIAIASLIPAITIAPIVLTGALISATGVGIYSITRSSIELHDRRIHQQSISLRNEQARNCYLNIAAGATCAVTSGSTKIASLALNRGIIISETAATALLSLNSVNMVVNGCNVANSLYKVIIDVKNKKKPSAIDIMHLATTFLFFGHAVINLRSACVIYKESQSKPFAELVSTRSQDLWKRAKDLFFKADVTTSENNSSLKKINDSNDYCQSLLAVTVRERGVETIQKATVDMLKDLIFNIDLDQTISFARHIVQNKDNAYGLCTIILTRFENEIQKILLVLVKHLLQNVIQEAFKPLTKIFPQTEKFVIFLNFVINFIKLKVTELEIEYQEKKAEALKALEINEDEYEKNYEPFDNLGGRMVYFLKITAMHMICGNGKPEEIICREMVRFFWDWLSQKIAERSFAQNQQGRTNCNLQKKVDCKICGGHYFEK